LSQGTHVIRLSSPGRQDYETKVYIDNTQEVVQIEL
jgi:hypothetical protein